MSIFADNVQMNGKKALVQSATLAPFATVTDSAILATAS